jgi:hypothetical protein
LPIETQSCKEVSLGYIARLSEKKYKQDIDEDGHDIDEMTEWGNKRRSRILG